MPGSTGCSSPAAPPGSLDMIANIFWLTRHYFVPPAVVPTGFWRSYGFDFLVIDGDGRAALATCGTTDPPVIDDIRRGLDVEQLVVDAIRDLGLSNGRLGLVGSEILPWTVATRLRREFPDLEFEAADLLMAQVRLTLSDAECDMVRQSVAAGSRMLLAGLGGRSTRGDGWRHRGGRPGVSPPGRSASSTGISSWPRGPSPASTRRARCRRGIPSGHTEPGDMIHPDCYGYVDGYMYDVQRTDGGRGASRAAAAVADRRILGPGRRPSARRSTTGSRAARSTSSAWPSPQDAGIGAATTSASRGRRAAISGTDTRPGSIGHGSESPVPWSTSHSGRRSPSRSSCTGPSAASARPGSRTTGCRRPVDVRRCGLAQREPLGGVPDDLAGS